MEYALFTVTSGIDGKKYEVRFRTLTTGIAPRHSDTADVRFLVDGKPAVVSIPMVALTNYRSGEGRPLGDSEVIQLAALILKEEIEKEGLSEDRMIAATAEQTLEYAGKIYSLAR